MKLFLPWQNPFGIVHAFLLSCTDMIQLSLNTLKLHTNKCRISVVLGHRILHRICYNPEGCCNPFILSRWLTRVTSVLLSHGLYWPKYHKVLQTPFMTSAYLSFLTCLSYKTCWTVKNNNKKQRVSSKDFWFKKERKKKTLMAKVEYILEFNCL